MPDAAAKISSSIALGVAAWIGVVFYLEQKRRRRRRRSRGSRRRRRRVIRRLEVLEATLRALRAP